jgi:hypothetical protein
MKAIHAQASAKRARPEGIHRYKIVYKARMDGVFIALID